MSCSSSDHLVLLLGLSPLTEAVLEAAGEVLEVPHAAGTSSLTTDSLVGPVDCRKYDQ